MATLRSAERCAATPAETAHLSEVLPAMSRLIGDVRSITKPESTSRGRGKRTRIALLTPVFDDWACFASLVSDIAAQYTGSDVEFYVCAVDDASVTSFDPTALSLPQDCCIIGVEVLSLALNLGHQRAIAVGLCALAEREDIDAVIVMDSDGEDRPVDIAALLAANAEHPGHIILARRSKRSESLVFRFCYLLYKFAFHMLTGKALNFGNFSLLPMSVVRRLVYMPELWNNLAASLIRSRLQCTAVPTARGCRYHGRSRMNLISLMVHGLSALSVHLDTIFVRVSLAAALVAITSLVGIITVAVIRFTTDLAIPGWATTAVGDLMIILMQTVVIIVAATLTMLAGRSSRPIIPIVDARQYVTRREHFSPAKASTVGASRG